MHTHNDTYMHVMRMHICGFLIGYVCRKLCIWTCIQEHVIEKIAYCLTELNLIDEVDKFCKQFLKIYPKNKTILSYYRRNLFKIGRYEEGLKSYQKETGVIEFNNDKINII